MQRKYRHLLLIVSLIGCVVVLTGFYVTGFIPEVNFPYIYRASFLGEESASIVSPQVGIDSPPTHVPAVQPDNQENTLPKNPDNGTTIDSGTRNAYGPGLATEEGSAVSIQPATDIHTVRVTNAPKEITDGDMATFTWQVNGPIETIQSSTIYAGPVSDSRQMTQTTSPSSTAYAQRIPDFLDGSYRIPLTFTASTKLSPAGTFYYRPYARINGKNIWGDEGTVVVHAVPKHEIRVIDRPGTVATGERLTFTWEIVGPQATTGFVVVAGGLVSKPGTLDSSYALTMTPYGILVNDFTKGSYAVPLRFIGNAQAGAPGTYYFRILAFINNTNVWSEEYTFTVQG